MSEESAAFEGFLLGLRVLYGLYRIEEPATAFERPWSVLKEVAEGRLTIANPAELAARHPGMRSFVYERANQIVANDRETAASVLRGLQESLHGRPAGDPGSG